MWLVSYYRDFVYIFIASKVSKTIQEKINPKRIGESTRLGLSRCVSPNRTIQKSLSSLRVLHCL